MPYMITFFNKAPASFREAYIGASLQGCAHQLPGSFERHTNGEWCAARLLVPKAVQTEMIMYPW